MKMSKPAVYNKHSVLQVTLNKLYLMKNKFCMVFIYAY